MEKTREEARKEWGEKVDVKLRNNPLKIVSWNCHYGLTAKKMATILETQPDLLVIQECQKNDFDVLKSNWNYKNWYGDDLNNEESNLGIAIFSNKYEIKFTEIFNRKYRYVVPYTIFRSNEIVFHLFVVWTKPVSGPCFYDDFYLKKKSCYYQENVIDAINSNEYSVYKNKYTMIIGDFNTGTNREDDKHIQYYTDLVKGLNKFINIAKGTKEEYEPTYYQNGKFYINDFCFISEKMENICKIKLSVLNDWQNENNGKKSWKGLSDHCPIVVDLEMGTDFLDDYEENKQ